MVVTLVVANGNNKDIMDELNKIIDRYTEGNYLIGKTAKEEMAKDILALFSVSKPWLFLDCRDDGTWLVKHSESKKVEWSGDSKQNALEYIYRHTMCHVC